MERTHCAFVAVTERQHNLTTVLLCTESPGVTTAVYRVLYANLNTRCSVHSLPTLITAEAIGNMAHGQLLRIIGCHGSVSDTLQ
jgi:hypothetical protein